MKRTKQEAQQAQQGEAQQAQPAELRNSLVNTWRGLNSGKDRTGACSTYWW